MVLVRIPTISFLNRIALKKIFDKLTYDEEKILEEGLQQHLRKKFITKPEIKEINHIITCLIRNEKGEFKEKRETLKKHNIPYQAVYRKGI